MANDVDVGEYFNYRNRYRKLDPDTYTDIYDDMFLKRYTTALISLTMKANLPYFKSYSNVGWSFSEWLTEQIYTQASR